MRYTGGRLSVLKFFAKEYFVYALFWLAFFAFSRLVFLGVNFEEATSIAPSDYWGMFIHGLHMDISMFGYVVSVAALFFIISCWISPSHSKQTTSIVTFILLLLLSAIIIPDTVLFGYWGFRMDATPLMYLKTPSLAAASMSVTQLLLGPLLVILYSLGWWWLYYHFIYRESKVESRFPWWSILLISLNIIPIRGGFGIAPMNPGKAYFSKDNFTNQATINVAWNVFYSVNKIKDTDRKYEFMQDKEAEEIVKQLYEQSGETQHILNTSRPNVILLIMESFTANATYTLGGMKGVTPNLDSLMHEGVLFSGIYNDGQRSEKGLVSILSGYPAQTTTSIIKHNSKIQKLPVLSKEFAKLGYHTGYFHGGDIAFANMRTYLISAEFDKYITESDFTALQKQSKWGAQDGFVFDRMFGDIQNEKQPFFYTMFTLSSHEPFDVPMKTVIKGNDEYSKFKNAAHYTDMCLGRFIREAKKTSWWNNTLVVIIADHGRSLDNAPEIYSEKRNRIPMLWLGGALKEHGIVVKKNGVQHDLAATLLAQLDLDHSAYTFSRNLLDKKFNDFGMFTYNNGFGFIQNGGVMVYDNTGHRYQQEVNADSTLKKKGKALFQVYTNHFLSL